METLKIVFGTDDDGKVIIKGKDLGAIMELEQALSGATSDESIFARLTELAGVPTRRRNSCGRFLPQTRPSPAMSNRELLAVMEIFAKPQSLNDVPEQMREIITYYRNLVMRLTRELALERIFNPLRGQ